MLLYVFVELGEVQERTTQMIMGLEERKGYNIWG